MKKVSSSVQELHMNRICARWVPRMLSEENMTNRTEASRPLLRKFSQSGIGFLDRIITTDETWFHYYYPEAKQQSSQWKNVDSPRSKIENPIPLWLNFLRNCLDASVLFVIFSSDNILGTHRAQMRFICSSST
jgi:hypothetical protein